MQSKLVNGPFRPSNTHRTLDFKISAKTSQEGTEFTKAKEYLISYCLIYILCRQALMESYDPHTATKVEQMAKDFYTSEYWLYIFLFVACWLLHPSAQLILHPFALVNEIFT